MTILRRASLVCKTRKLTTARGRAGCVTSPSHWHCAVVGILPSCSPTFWSLTAYDLAYATSLVVFHGYDLDAIKVTTRMSSCQQKSPFVNYVHQNHDRISQKISDQTKQEQISNGSFHNGCRPTLVRQYPDRKPTKVGSGREAEPVNDGMWI
jgi:hypothetical protein